MLWLCLSLPHLPVEALDLHEAAPCVVYERSAARRKTLACNQAARDAGLQAGMDVSDVLLRCPQVKLLVRSLRNERAALHWVANWAGQYSSHVCLDTTRWLVWIEIGGSLRCFDGLDALLAQVHHSLAALGHVVHWAVAPTLEAAALLAQHAPERRVLEQSSMTLSLASLPIAALAISSATHEALTGIGWRYLSDVLALPAEQLARRFGPDLTAYLQRLMGARPDVRALYRAPPRYQRRLELMAVTDSLETLLFPLRRMVSELEHYLRSRDTALQTLQLVLHHERHAGEQKQACLVLRTSAPQRDAAQLLALLRETLERQSLSAPVLAMSLKVDTFTPLLAPQLELFDATAKRNQQWNHLLDKLRARLGEQAVRRLGLREDHLPEQAWVMNTEAEQKTEAQSTASFQPERPLWLLPATPLHSLPRLLGKPERIESGWWRGTDAQRDYYIAETAEGSRWWLYHDVAAAQWYLQGLWA